MLPARSASILSVFAFAFWFSVGESWAPKTAPLMTTFADEVSPTNAWPLYPRPQMTRDRWLNLNGLWTVEVIRGKEIRISDEILVPFPIESALSGVMERVTENDTIRYTRQFTVPQTWDGSSLLLHIDACDWQARVSVNGIRVAFHQGGYTRISADISAAIKRGQNNSLVVTAWDPTDTSYIPRGKQVQESNGIFYTSTSGIWQTVWLEPVPLKNSIKSIHMVPDVDESSVTFSVSSAYAYDETALVYLTKNDEDILWGQGPLYQEFKLSLRTIVENVQFWSPSNPHLYKIKIELSESKDVVRSYFGMRKISYGRDDKGIVRFMLNNKPIFMAGVLDQGFWPDGIYTPPSEAAMLFDLINIKNFYGMNTIRKHVKVEPERWYYWCDVLGLLVEQDMPSGDRFINPDQPDINRTAESAANYFREWTEIIQSRWNHPSIVTWIPFNEGWGQFNSTRVVQYTAALDPFRLVVGASGWCDRNVSDVIDLHVYVGPDPNVNDLKNRGNRVAQLGEFGALGLKVDGHMWDASKAFSVIVYNTTDELNKAYDTAWKELIKISADPKVGFSSGIFTQVTDVEFEVNGMFTYDRKILKIQPQFWPAAYANEILFGSTEFDFGQDTAAKFRARNLV